MKANELRIGNLFTIIVPIEGSWMEQQRYDKEIYQVSAITFQLDKFEYFRGIPLSEEWLLKFGFKKHRRALKLKNFGQFIVMGDKLCFYPAGQLDTMFRWDLLQYVHQLQNLYFALMGKELKIV